MQESMLIHFEDLPLLTSQAKVSKLTSSSSDIVLQGIKRGNAHPAWSRIRRVHSHAQSCTEVKWIKKKHQYRLPLTAVESKWEQCLTRVEQLEGRKRVLKATDHPRETDWAGFQSSAVPWACWSCQELWRPNEVVAVLARESDPTRDQTGRRL